MQNPIAPVKGGRRLTSDRIRFIRLADNAELGCVSRGQLVGLVHQLPIIGLINGTEAHLLTILLNTAPAAAFSQGGKPIVFKSNRQLGFEIGRSEGRVSRLLSRLYDCGLVVMRDSGNFKRYPVRGSDGKMITACGIDLRVFIARYHELQQQVEETRNAQSRKTAALRRFRGLYRQIQASVEIVVASPFVLMLAARVRKIMDVVGNPKQAGFLQLERAIRLFDWILCRIFSVKMTCPCVENDIHKQNTNPDHICNCNDNQSTNQPASHTDNKMRPAYAGQPVSTDVGSAHEKQALEKESGKTDAPFPSEGSALPHITPHVLSKALPYTASYLQGQIHSISDILQKTELLAGMIGISSDAINQAKRVMGLEKTALAVSITLEKYYRGSVKSPGGYIRAMTQRAERGELHLVRSLQGLISSSL